jgi:hypothetical protein
MFGGIFPRRRGHVRGKQIVFLAINKTGSSSLWTWLDEHRVDYFINRYQDDERRKQEVIAEAKRRRIPCFTVVRNPWSRAVSSWKWCMQQKGLPECSFEEFLRLPLERMTPQQRFHTSPQWQHVVDEHGGVDYLHHIGRFESLDGTRDWLVRTLGLRGRDALPHVKSSGGGDYASHYTPVSRALVAEIFRKDIELFGYGFDAESSRPGLAEQS